jgi:hypothetical protein
MPILAFFFAATWFVQGAMAAHLGLPQAAGASSTAAIVAAASVGSAVALVPPGLLVLHPIGAMFVVVSSRSGCCTAPATA